jgi:(R,R)-butanediol dehydrogenase/meso-butanediol dehydrogenase/diacetyl reductase
MTAEATMRAAVYHGARDVRVEERPVPVPGPGELLIRVSRAGICGTDAGEYAHGPAMIPLHTRHPGSGHLGPVVLGHEFTGTAVAAGAGAEALVGQRVASGAGVWCGECRWCRAGRPNLCARYWTLGLSADGGLAGYAAVPAATCVPVPAGCTEDAAGLAQPLAVGLHAARRAGVRAGDVVVLLGAGAIGSFILCGLTGPRPERVIALDIDDERLRTARALGATDCCNVRDADPVAAVRELTGADGADVVIEATGTDGAAANAVAMAARGGQVLLVGLPHRPQPLDLAGLTLREVDVAGTVAHVCDEDLPAALRLLAAGSIAGRLLDRVIGLDAIVIDGLEALLEGRAAGKVLVDPWS